MKFGRESLIHLLAIGALLLVIGMIQEPAFAAKEKGSRCSDGLDNDGDGLIDAADPDCGGGGGGGGATKLRVTLNWLDDSFDDTTLEFDAVTICDPACRTEGDLGSSGFLNLPASAGTIISSTRIQQTDLDADVCFDFDGDTVLQITELGRVTFHLWEAEARWLLTIKGFACDMDSTVTDCDVRDYELRVLGDCTAGSCPFMPSAVGDISIFDGGRINAIWSNGPDKKQGIPCRCTQSNHPECPGDAALAVGVDVPAAEVVIEVVP